MRVRQRRAIALAVLAALLGALGGWLDRGTAPPADLAARFVPADALIYVHASTDPGRAEDERLLETLGRFPSFQRLRDGVRQAVSQQANGFDFNRDVRSWLGDEAAFALLDSGGTAANSLLVMAVEKEPTAQAVLLRAAGASGAVRYRGVVLRRFGGVTAAFAGGFLLVGQEPAVREAIDVHAGRGRALDDLPAYARAAADRPEERSLDAWMATGGVRRVLAPLPGFAGAFGGFLDHPALEGISVSAVAEKDGLRLTGRQLRSRAAGGTFEPDLLDAVPDSAAGYLGISGLGSAGRLVPTLLERARALVPDIAQVDIDRDVLEPLRGEVAVSVTPSLPLPVLTITARTSDEERTREAMGRLQGVITDLLFGTEDQTGQVPTFEERDVGGGVTAYALQLSPGVEILYAVFDGRLVLSTAPAGIRRAREGGASLRDEKRFERTVGSVPDRVEAVLFLDLGQLLALGDVAGLTASPAFKSVRDDLQRIRAIGAVATRQGTDTTAELFVEIP